MAKLPSSLPMALQPTRATTTATAASLSSPSQRLSQCSHQVRHATFIARPRRPYTFTQLIQLSDGSTYTCRTTSPNPFYRAAKDTRNSILWQPSERSLRNVELDEAGRLAAFRARFGRGFDAASEAEDGEGAEAEAGADGEAAEQQEPDDGGFADLMSEYAPEADKSLKAWAPKKAVQGKKKK